jgi:phosphoribosylanthranilate isomerase
VRTRVKICCISSVDEALSAVSAGADALGLVADMPSGPGVIEDELAREIAATVPPDIDTFLLTSRMSGTEIVEHVRYCGTSVVQIVRHIEPTEYQTIIRGLPTIRRVQVIHVESEDALRLIDVYSPLVDAFLLDSGRPSAETEELGGTGRVHDWQISEQFVRMSKKPVFLAGGLAPSNVGEAMRTVRPYGLDLCSGVRADGKLDRDKLASFMQAVETAQNSIPGLRP